MEDYKEKYEKALSRASYIKDYNTVATPQEVAELLFPELKESEDERIRKELKTLLDKCLNIRPQLIEEKEYLATLAWLEKQGEQKPTNKVKPKFKVGDWIVTPDNEIKQIEKVAFGNYWCTDETLYDIIDIDNKGHLWTIQDAKEGDVLHAHSFASDCVFLYKNTYEVEPYNKVDVAYCCIDVYSNRIEFGIQGPDCIDVRNTKPATKEQRDLLFQKMKEAGYEWDVEKKELKKIEQKTIFCHHEVDLSNCSEEYRKAYYDGWNNCNQQHAQLEAEQKPAWSEKGTKIIEEAASFILACVNIADTKEEEERLEKLADKLQDLRPQLKQEWSEEDEYNLNWIINDYERASQTAISSFWEGRFKMFVDWLKSLKERMKGE